MLETARSTPGEGGAEEDAASALVPAPSDDASSPGHTTRDAPLDSDVRSLGASRWARTRPLRERLVIEGSDWALDGSTLLFALWTLCCHLTVLRHGTGYRLLVTFALALPCALLGLRWMRARTTTLGPTPLFHAPAQIRVHEPPSTPQIPWRSMIGLAGAVAVVIAWRQLQSPWYFWLHSAAFLLISCGLVFSERLPAPAEPAARLHVWEGQLLWLMGLCCAAYTAMLNRPNSDDALYINIGATLRDHPEYELFAGDTLHGHGMTLMRAYAASSVELFAGMLGWLTHTAALRIMHLSLAPIAGLLTAFAFARLLRLIEPDRWLWLLAVVLSFYVLDGAAERTVAGHGFIRIFQGKAMLVTMAVPLIAANAIAFATRASAWRWLLFASAVVTGIGLSSTGIWLALVVGMTGLAVPLRFERAYFKALAWGALALLYPLLFALWMRSQLSVASGGHAVEYALPATWAAASASAAGMTYELSALAFGKVAHVYLALVLLAWPLARGPLARRYLLLFTLGAFVVLLNPILSTFVAANLTGKATYSRALWYLPLAVAFATCFGAALPTRARSKLALGAGTLVTVLALGWFGVNNPELSTLPWLQFPPQEKVNPEGCKVSRFLARNMDDQSVVLAPVAVSLCLPMVQHSPLALMTKPKFFDDGGRDRFALRRIIDGGHRVLLGMNRRKFISALESYNVRAVVLARGVEETSGVVATLTIAGFHEAKQFPTFIVYLRDEPWPPKTPASG